MPLLGLLRFTCIMVINPCFESPISLLNGTQSFGNTITVLCQYHSRERLVELIRGHDYTFGNMQAPKHSRRFSNMGTFRPQGSAWFTITVIFVICDAQNPYNGHRERYGTQNNQITDIVTLNVTLTVIKGCFVMDSWITQTLAARHRGRVG